MRARHLTLRVRRGPLLIASVALAVATVGLWQAPSLAVVPAGGIHDSGIQELDGTLDFTGNTTSYTSSSHDTAIETSPPYDWTSLFTSTSGGVITRTGAVCQPGSCSGLISDVGLPYTGDLFTQGSKDVNDVGTWTCTQQSTPPKDQLVNAYASAWTAPTTHGAVMAGDTVAFMGLERPNTNGNSNAGFWLFKKSTLCDPATGSFSGGHSNGDVFLVGSFLSGGTNAVLNEYSWNCTQVSTTDPSCSTTGSLVLTKTGALNCPAITVTTDTFCQVVNQKTTGTGHSAVITNWTVLTPWSNIATGTAGIPGPGFLEMGIDLSQALATPGAPAPCFASFLADTRSSGSSTQAETKNFINGSFPTCGNLTVKKYIDADLDPNGTSGDIAGGPDGSDVTSGTDVSNWAVAVTSGANNLCTGTTNTTGTLTCATGSGLTNLPSGTALSVTETVPAAAVTNTAPAPGSNPAPKYFNTDPGVVPASGSVSSLVGTTVTKSATMGPTDKTVYVGNTCFVNFTFEVDGVPNTAPTATKKLTVSYTVASGNYNGSLATGTIDLKPIAAGSSTWTGLVQNKFVQNDSVTWTWQSIDFSDVLSPVQTGGTENLSTDGYPGCAGSTKTNFGPTTVGGIKYKDANHDGVRNSYTNPITATSALEPLAAGFTLSLYTGDNCGATSGTLVTTATSASTADSDGFNYSFGAQAPGAYSVKEAAKTGWRQTGPLASGVVQPCVTVTVTLGDSTDHPAAIGNTPLSTITAGFTTLSGSTNSKISCTTADGGGDTLPGFTLTGSYTGANVEDGTYTCTIIVADP